MRAIGTAALVSLALGTSGVSAALTTRTEDQRLAHAEPAEDEHAHLGTSVGMGEGIVTTTALVGMPQGGASGGGSRHFFRWNGSAWQWQSGSSPAPTGTPQSFPVDEHLGTVISAHHRPDGMTQVTRILPAGGSNTFLISLPGEVEALAYDGSYYVFGMPDYDAGRGRIDIYRVAGTDLVDTLIGADPGDRLGSSLALGGVMLVAGAPGVGDNGVAYLFVCCDAADQWLEWQTLDSPATSQTGAEFGAAVDITPDGDWIAVGSPLVDRVITPGERVDVGAVYLYEHVGFEWQLDLLLRPPGAGNYDHFGTSLALHRSFLVGGSPGEDGAAGNQGAAYVWHLTDSGWESTPRLRLVDSAAVEDDGMGRSVAAGDLGVLVGAPHADGNGVLDAGAVLFYRDAGAFFADGFEGGVTTAWSGAAP